MLTLAAGAPAPWVVWTRRIACCVVFLAAIEARAQIPHFIYQWGTFGSGDGQFNLVTGAALDGTGKVVALDYTNQRVQVFTASGDFLGQWTTVLPGEIADDAIVAVSVNAHGEVFIVDWNDEEILVFSIGGTFLRRWGSPGSAPGQFSKAYDVAVAPNDLVYVADHHNERVQVFSRTGEFVTQWATPGRTYSVAAGADGRIYVGVGFGASASVRVYTPMGDLLAQWGPTAVTGPFSCEGLALDASSQVVYLADDSNQRVLIYTNTGDLVGELREFLFDPRSVAVDDEGTLFVADMANHRVRVYGFGPVPSRRTTWGGVKRLFR